ncbi:DUF192 domain-containing protein [Leptobacterium sp. I13]|uniref:DUF192 domain-containing protein n=1 Tax=Leptobacterium meishanense TaxID=3128904 RepID=UPI0030EE3DA3
MKVFSSMFILIALVGLTVACNDGKKKSPVKKQVVAFKKEGTLQLLKPDQPVYKTIDIEIADNDYETETGLMYRTSMEENHGMLFIFKEEAPRYFYMKNTEIPLDIIYINSELKIVSFVENATPFDEASLPSNFPAKYVLELNAGLVKQWNVQVGDSISFIKD